MMPYHSKQQNKDEVSRLPPLFGVPKNVLWTRSLYKSTRVEMAKCKAPLLNFWGPRNFRTAELYSQKGCLKKIKTLMLRRYV